MVAYKQTEGKKRKKREKKDFQAKMRFRLKKDLKSENEYYYSINIFLNVLYILNINRDSRGIKYIFHSIAYDVEKIVFCCFFYFLKWLMNKIPIVSIVI